MTQPSRLLRPTRGKQGRKMPPSPDVGSSLEKFDRPAVVGRWGNSVGVAPGDGGSDLRQKAVGGSPWVALHDGVLGRGRVIGDRPEKGSRLALKWMLRSLGLGRCSGWSRCGRRRAEAAVDGGRGTAAMAARVEWWELDGNCGKRSEWLFLWTDGEGVGCMRDGCMCNAWSGGGGWSAASADSITLRWQAAEQLSCTRGASVWTSAQSAAHGELHVWCVEAEGSWQRSEQRWLSALSCCARSERHPGVRALGKMADGPAVRVGLGRYCRTGLSPMPN
jgi:hypothetical protein